MPEAPSIEELMVACRQSAVHLEMRDGYMWDDPRFIAWQEGRLDVGALYATSFEAVWGRSIPHEEYRPA
ncbi:hypothetical protein ACFZB9_16530 [Kitasatospora sp. NPDC008050]|uniref:hypothetical protein n=1 Tax=Kitasatospora sp. NPDC008050 TaxID=3364021 RepID=UPI0036F17162